MQRGAAAELLAAEYLRARGLHIVARNVRYRLGELDMVCLDGDVLAIVEVRQRVSPGYGGALSSVTRRKQRKLIRAAQRFLQTHAQWRAHALRFDVVALQGPEDGTRDIAWIKAAFVT